MAILNLSEVERNRGQRVHIRGAQLSEVSFLYLTGENFLRPLCLSLLRHSPVHAGVGRHPASPGRVPFLLGLQPGPGVGVGGSLLSPAGDAVPATEAGFTYVVSRPIEAGDAAEQKIAAGVE